MTHLSHPWIRELYGAALETRYEDFPRVAMLRAAGEFDCAAVMWQQPSAATRCAVRAPGLASERLEGLDLAAPTLQAQVAPLVLSIHPVHSTRDAPHLVGFARIAHGFSEQERSDLAGVAEHLVGAETVARECARRNATVNGPEPEWGQATVDVQGRLLSADDRFRDLVRSIGQEDSTRLPFPLPDGEGARIIHVRGLHVRVHREGNRVELRVRRDRRTAMLSTRELEIAERVALGMTFKEIARELSLAQSTVSTHVYNVYAKLGIRRRYDLVHWLSANAAVAS